MKRESALDKFTTEELVDMVKEECDKLGIPWEDKPGGFDYAFRLDLNQLFPEVRYEDTNRLCNKQ